MTSLLNTASYYSSLAANWMYYNQEATLALWILGAVAFCLGLKFLKHRGVKMDNERARQKAVIAPAITDAIDQLYLQDLLPKRSRRYWYARLSKAMEIPDLKPRSKKKKVSFQAIKAKMEHFSIAENTSANTIPGPKPGEMQAAPAPPAKRNIFAKLAS